MGPEDAATAVQLVGASAAVPVHYAHNPLVLGPNCGELFKAAVARAAPGTAVTLLRPGQTTTLSVATMTR
jgi:L-ascorbate metabolism protein UlaG (beta-lactamase superfamily)